MSNNAFASHSTEGFEKEKDVLGGGGTVPSNIYKATVEMAYVVNASASKSQGVAFILKLDSGMTVRETVYVLNRQGENTYPDKKDATKKHLLPGWQTIDSLCMMATGLGLTDQDMEEKSVLIYDFDAGKEVPKKVQVITSLLGKEVGAAILEQTVDKTKQNESTKAYEPTGETRDENTVDKFFHADTMRTTSECIEGIDEAIFAPKWLEKNEGKKKNKSKGKAGKAGAPGGAGGGAPKPKESLFGKK
jgi:hypothetical protein